jgi:hypothetical protein
MLTFAEVHEWMALANLVLLVSIVSVMIGVSILLQRKRKFVWHGNVMLVVIMIATLMTVAHMGYGFVFVVKEAIESFNWVAFMGIVHGIIGLVTLSLGIWLVGMWSLGESSEIRFCAPRKNLMWKILALWIVTLAIGIVYYPLHLILG